MGLMACLCLFFGELNESPPIGIVVIGESSGGAEHLEQVDP
jgi:hypothetical protein